MNERIRGLSKQAFEYTLDQLNSGLEFRDFQPIWSEKFAQLIVAECADVCENLQKWPSTEPRHCANDIRIHFGVEE